MPFERFLTGPLHAVRGLARRVLPIHRPGALPASKRMSGEVTERLKELAWKASTAHKVVGGSNPPLSAILRTVREGGVRRVPSKGAA